jgi:hypothetical protein
MTQAHRTLCPEMARCALQRPADGSTYQVLTNTTVSEANIIERSEDDESINSPVMHCVVVTALS